MPLPTFTLTATFVPGTTGKVVLVNPYVLLDTAGDEISPPFEYEFDLVSAAFSEEVVSGEDPDVSPNPWEYIVYFRLDGQVEQKFRALMPFEDADLTDILDVGQPPNPDYYALASHTHEGGGGGGGVTSHGDLDDLDVPADHPWAALATDLTAEIANRITDVNSEESRAIAAENAIAAGLASEITNRVADVDAEQARAEAAEALLAPIASPTFTGNPQAPSPTAGDNDTSIATTQFVTGAIATAIADLIAGAPGALNDLNELAAALGDDANFAATVTSALALKINAAVLTNDGDLLTRIAGVPARITRAGLASDAAFTGTYETISNAAALFVPKAIGTTKGDIITFTGSGVPVRRGVGANGTFLVGNSANSDGWETRVLAYTDLPVLPKSTMSVGTKVVSTGTDTIMGLTADTNPGVTVSQTHAFHSDSTNRSRMTIPSGLDGDYLCFFAFNLGGTDATGSRRARLLKNGSTLATLLSPDAPAAIPAIETASYYAVGLVAGDYLEVQVFQDSGGALNFTMSSFTIIRFP